MDYQDKKVLVTGGTGFIGSHFVETLLNEGARVRITRHKRRSYNDSPKLEVVEADLTNPEDCLKACTDIDFVFHAAGAVSSAATTVTNPMHAITENLVLTARVLEASWASGVKRALVFSSGTTGYPSLSHPVREEEMFSDDPAPVYYGYGWMRRYLEILSKYVSSKANLQVRVCRPTAVYGPRDNFDPKTSHVVPALIHRAINKENPFVVWGTGDEVRDFLHVRDLVHGCLLLLAHETVDEPINIGSGLGITVREIVQTVLRETTHNEAKVIFDTSKPTTIPVRLVDTGKARKILGFSPSISFDNGIRETVQWYRSHCEESL